jgi:HAD superfamily hydrolase (TIGR01509 family)
MRIEPHLKSVLRSVRPRVKTAIATNRTDTMNRVLKEHGLTDLFDLVVTALDVKQAKPHPEMLKKALSHFGLNRDQGIFVGDSLVDQQAAKAAKMPFAAFANRSLAADYHIDRLDALLPLCAGVGS